MNERIPIREKCSNKHKLCQEPQRLCSTYETNKKLTGRKETCVEVPSKGRNRLTHDLIYELTEEEQHERGRARGRYLQARRRRSGGGAAARVGGRMGCRKG